MGDKRLMDNKVVKNPLLSGVNQTSFIQDFVQSSLIVPAAPPKHLQTTADATKSGTEKSLEKASVTGDNKLQTAVLPTVSCPSPALSSASAIEKGHQFAQPILVPLNQNTSVSPSVTASSSSSSLTEIPLNKSGSSVSPVNQPAPESTPVNPPPKFTGPPPLTSYNRPSNKLLSSRYLSSSYLQTIPSAQFFSQSSPNSPSVSPSNSLQNFPKSSSSSPITYFVPQQETVSVHTSSTTSSSSLSQTPSAPPNQIYQATPKDLQTPISNLTNANNINLTSLHSSTVPSIPGIKQSTFGSHSSHSESASLLQATQPPVLTPAKVSVPTLHPVSSLPSLTSVDHPEISPSIPSLPVSQPIIVPTTPGLLPASTSVTYLSDSQVSPNYTSVPPASLSTTSHKNLINPSDSVFQTSSESSSVLRSRSPSPLPIAPSENSSSPTTFFSPAVLDLSTSESKVSLINNIVSVNNSASDNISQTSESQTVSPTLSTRSVFTSPKQETSSTYPSFSATASPRTEYTDSSLTTPQTLPLVTSSYHPAIPSQNNFSNSVSGAAVTTVVKSLPSTPYNFAGVPSSSVSASTTTITSPVSGTPPQEVLHQSPPPNNSSVETSSSGQNSEILPQSTFFQPVSSSVTSSERTLSLDNKSILLTSSLQVVTATLTTAESQILSDSVPSNVTSASPPQFQTFQNNSFPISQSSSEKQPTSQFPFTSENLSGKFSVSNTKCVKNILSTPSHSGETLSNPSDKNSLLETSQYKSPVSAQVELISSTSSTSVQTSTDHTKAQPSLFTFATPYSGASFVEPPNQLCSYPSVQTNLIQSLSDLKTTSSTEILASETCATTFSQAQQSFPCNIPSQLKESVNKTVPLNTPPLLDPSKFFSTSPPQADKFINPLVTGFHVGPPPSLSVTASGFTPLPPRKFAAASVTNLFASTLPSPPNPTILNKDSAKPQNISTLTSPSPPPPLRPSHTPPPPYSSLDFVSRTVEPETHHKGNIAPALVPQNGATITSQDLNVKDEELDQIPLDGNTVPLYNPFSIGAFSQHTPKPSAKGGTSNTYRLGSGLKRPSYAPVPDLGITHHVSQVFTTMSGPPPLQMSTTTSTTVTTPSTTPSSSVASSPPPESSSFNYSVTAQGQIYRPPYHHWFYKKGGETKALWYPFSMADSLNLEQVFTSPDLNENTKVPTDGGRYDVEVLRRRKIPVYWEESPGEVRRCSWFVRAPIESRYIPYDENIAEILEDAYKTGCIRNEWNRRVELADGEVIILHSPNAMAHHQRSSSPDAWGNPPAMQQKPRIVKRGLEDFEISEGEPNQVDHLLLMVHGIGKVCDLRFRSLVQVVDDFRNVSLQLVQSHFRSGITNGNVGRVEVLPVEWHRALHTEIIDKRLADITLPSIPKAREFTNDVLLDILFYTSPVFCERIVQAVGAEINRVYDLYMSRNPGFRGGVSLGGHSLGSLILFDMLCHQKPQRSMKTSFSPQSSIPEGDEDMPEVGCLKAKARLSRRMSYLTIGSAGTGQPYIVYPQLHFQPKAFFALGSPIGMFLTVRGIESLGEEFKFPTCPKFFNIFHPHDPVAYRIEALVSPQMIGIPAVVIPHHKGRKRMHLELKDTMHHVTAALKQKLVDSMRSTWNTVYQLAMFHRSDSSIQQEVDKVIENEILTNNECEQDTTNQIMISDQEALNLKVGSLNGGNRIDYVLQEAPLETFNQYISAVRSHVVYWESLDTMLLILKELYATIGISADSQIPQPILPFDISSDTGNESYSEYTDSIGAPPTQFIRK